MLSIWKIKKTKQTIKRQIFGICCVIKQTTNTGKFKLEKWETSCWEVGKIPAKAIARTSLKRKLARRDSTRNVERICYLTKHQLQKFSLCQVDGFSSLFSFSFFLPSEQLWGEKGNDDEFRHERSLCIVNSPSTKNFQKRPCDVTGRPCVVPLQQLVHFFFSFFHCQQQKLEPKSQREIEIKCHAHKPES